MSTSMRSCPGTFPVHARSAAISSSALRSMASATRCSDSARSAPDARPHAGCASRAAAAARSMSIESPAAIMSPGWPVLGSVVAKYAPLEGACALPPIQCPWRTITARPFQSFL